MFGVVLRLFALIPLSEYVARPVTDVVRRGIHGATNIATGEPCLLVLRAVATICVDHEHLFGLKQHTCHRLAGGLLAQ
ncbi:hypothetical protein OKW34_001004 [Paraburkholderia youngii]